MNTETPNQMTQSTERHSAESLALLEKALGNRDVLDLSIRQIVNKNIIRRISSLNERSKDQEEMMIAYHKDIVANEARIRAIIESL